MATNPFAGRKTPAWFEEAGFGIFVTWDPSSVPAFAPPGPTFAEQVMKHGPDYAIANVPYADFYWNSLSIDGSPVHQHHVATYGDRTYDSFVEEFKEGLSAWEPGPWADLFERTGARYVVLVSKHLDGFTLWPTKHRNPRRPGWHADRDVVGEMADACRSRGMRFGLLYSGGVDFTFATLPQSIPDIISGISDPEYCDYADAQIRELIELYRPDVLWNDMGWPSPLDPNEVIGYYYEHVPDGAVNDRFTFPFGSKDGAIHVDFTTAEYSTEPPVPGMKWESCRGVGQSFNYNSAEGPEWHLSTAEVMSLRDEVNAAGGNLLLNVGPAGDGTIPPLQLEVFEGLAASPFKGIKEQV